MEFTPSSVNSSTEALSTAELIEQCTNRTFLRRQEKENYDSSWWTFVTFITLSLCILSVTGNGILISAFAKDIQMRTATNMLVFSHLMAELVASSIGILSHLFMLVIDRKPSASSVLCVVVTCMVKICLGGGLLSLVGITVDRYLALVVKVHHKVTRRQMQVFLTVIWILSITYGIPWNSSKLFDGGIKWNYVAWLIVNCHVNEMPIRSTQRTAVDIFQYFFLSVGILMPLFIIAFTSFRIFRTAQRARRRVSIIGTNVSHITAAYMRSAVTTILIISVYFLCLIPTIALGAKCNNRYWDCRSLALFFFAKVTLCFRSVCFPVIFAARNRNCSKYIFQFLCCLCKRTEMFRKCLSFNQGRRRRSNKVHVLYRNCSSSRTINAHREATADTSNLGTRAFDVTRKLSFVDLKNIAI